MVVDYNIANKLKESDKEITSSSAKDLVIVLEQSPSTIIFHDITNYLIEHKYYASFNRAFFDETKEDLNIKLIKQLYGDSFGYQGAVRGKLFRVKF